MGELNLHYNHGMETMLFLLYRYEIYAQRGQVQTGQWYSTIKKKRKVPSQQSDLWVHSVSHPATQNHCNGGVEEQFKVSQLTKKVKIPTMSLKVTDKSHSVSFSPHLHLFMPSMPSHDFIFVHCVPLCGLHFHLWLILTNFPDISLWFSTCSKCK
jgi:hypothetical protein